MILQLKHIKYDIISEPLNGEIVCGDQFFIKENDDYTLLSVIDGLGHGEDAFFAAKKAMQTLDEHSDKSIGALITLCNESLLSTRGAAMTVAKIDRTGSLLYVGVGNVAAVCWARDKNMRLTQQSLMLEGGIVGSRLPPEIQTRKITLTTGDIIIFATDGIKRQFESEPPTFQTPEKIAKKIFDNYRNKNDDGLVLVAQLI